MREPGRIATGDGQLGLRRQLALDRFVLSHESIMTLLGFGAALRRGRAVEIVGVNAAGEDEEHAHPLHWEPPPRTHASCALVAAKLSSRRRVRGLHPAGTESRSRLAASKSCGE